MKKLILFLILMALPAACKQDIERIFPKLQRMELNTVYVSLYKE